jgi:cystathionine beta-lyase
LAPSKTFNLAGLSTSSVIIENDDIRGKYKDYIERIHLGTNLFGAVASEAAYSHGGEWLDGLKLYLAKNRDLVRSFLKDKLPDIVVSPLEATYLLWLDFGGLGMENDKIKDILINKVGVGLNDGRMFGPGGDGFFRMNIGCPQSTVEEALIRIEKSFTAIDKTV